VPFFKTFAEGIVSFVLESPLMAKIEIGTKKYVIVMNGIFVFIGPSVS
jgi:hypothetical protein